MSASNDNAEPVAPDEAIAKERRLNLRLREIFDAALVLIEPFFDPANSWGGHSLDHFAFRVLRENYPDLSSGEAQIFVTVARRTYASRVHSADASRP
jgi:hypothetical protein